MLSGGPTKDPGIGAAAAMEPAVSGGPRVPHAASPGDSAEWLA